MRNEAAFCTIVVNSLIDGAKIPDPSSGYGQTSKRTFDGVGMLKIDDKLTFICWEAKLLKELSAFNFKRIESHQSYYLMKYQLAQGVKSYLIVGVAAGRADNRAYVFEWNEKMNDLYIKGFSIHKKYLEKLPYNEIHKGVFQFDKIISYEDLCNLCETKECSQHQQAVKS